MKQKVLLIIIILVFGISKNKIYAEELCEFNFKLPERKFVKNYKENNLLANSNYKSKYFDKSFKVQWVLQCNQNTKRTSNIDELLEKAKKNNNNFSYHEIYKIDQKIETLLLSNIKVIKGRRIFTVESYFATRDFEYYFFIIPEGEAQFNLLNDFKDEIKREMKILLLSGKFSKKVKSTISEKVYKTRFYILMSVFSFLFILVFAFLIIKIISKKNFVRRF